MVPLFRKRIDEIIDSASSGSSSLDSETSLSCKEGTVNLAVDHVVSFGEK
jgi:hypothetical protein